MTASSSDFCRRRRCYRCRGDRRWWWCTTEAQLGAAWSGSRGRFPTADAVIFGHSHLPLHERAGDGFQIFNPGSPTERRRAPAHTMGLAKDAGGRIEFELVELR
jgi:predicted phosphodiesterase